MELNLNYGTPILWQSCLEVILTMLLYGGAFVGLTMSTKAYSQIFFTIILALTFLRIFIIQHDCGHGSLFKSKAVNTLVGHLCSLFTLTPFNYWRKLHNYHHLHFGISGESDLGYIETSSVEEFQSKNKIEKFLYVFTRSPLSLLFIIAPFVFIIAYRIPFLLKILFKKLSLANLTKLDYIECYLLDGLIMFIFGVLFHFFGSALLINYLISLYLASAIGMLLFYVQHNIDNLYYVQKSMWSQLEQGLKGSSFFKLPSILRWFTGNIGYHHIHHVCLKIPFYKLPTVHKLYSEQYSKVATISIKDIPRLLSLKLYDTNQGKMITWREYKPKDS